MIATQPVEAPGAVEMTQTGQDASLHPVADRPEVQPPGPTGLPATVSRRRSSVLAGTTVPVEDLAPEGGYVSDRASSQADEGEVSDLFRINRKCWILIWKVFYGLE